MTRYGPAPTDDPAPEDPAVTPPDDDDGDDLPSGLDAGVVSYYESPDGFGCGHCVFFVGEGQPCQVVATPVSTHGCCDLWEDKEGAQYTGPKLKAEAVVYMEGTSPSDSFVCGECSFLQPDGSCPVVGKPVSAETGTCTQWQPKPRRRIATIPPQGV